MANRTDIRERHSRKCKTHDGGRCNCDPAIEVRVWVPSDRKRRTRTFTKTKDGPGYRSVAKGWHTDAAKAVKDGKLRAPTSKTLQQAVDEFLQGAERGEIRKRNGQPYKPGVIRGYRSSLTTHVLPDFGDRRLDSIGFAELERLQERLQATMSGGTVRNAFVPLMTVFKRAKRAGVITTKPTDDLELPAAGRADRSATPKQAATAIAAVAEEDRALWATAFYAGLRRGELRALRIENITATYIDVQHGWDDVEGEQAPKSAAGIRRVPMSETLRPYLDAHIERAGRSGTDLAFGRTASLPFTPRTSQSEQMRHGKRQASEGGRSRRQGRALGRGSMRRLSVTLAPTGITATQTATFEGGTSFRRTRSSRRTRRSWTLTFGVRRKAGSCPSSGPPVRFRSSGVRSYPSGRPIHSGGSVRLGRIR